MKKIFVSIFFALVLVGVISVPTLAAKKKPTPPPAPQTPYIPLVVVPILNLPQGYVEVKLLSYSQVKSVSIWINYTINGIQEGAHAGINFGDNIDLKSSLNPYSMRVDLMTCSSNSCITHKDAKNIVVTVDTVYKSGKTTQQVFKLKP